MRSSCEMVVLELQSQSLFLTVSVTVISGQLAAKLLDVAMTAMAVSKQVWALRQRVCIKVE